MKYAAKALSLNATIAADVSDRRVMLDTIGPHGVETRARGHKQCTRTQWGLTATHTGFRSQRERRRFAQTGKAKFVHTTNTTHGATSFAPRLFYYFFCDVASRKSVHVNQDSILQIANVLVATIHSTCCSSHALDKRRQRAATDKRRRLAFNPSSTTKQRHEGSSAPAC